MTAGGPPRVAIVGSGPSGLYAAVDLLKRDVTAEVDMFDRLPTMGGLVRSGVSPDHGGRRKVISVYEQLAMETRRFRFHGNVEIGRDISHAELAAHHYAVIYASGAAGDRRLNIPGEDLPGSHAATDFVGWYNGHPDFASLTFDLSCERAVVVGNGNVALDVARMLLLPVDVLRRTDIADHALEALSRSRVREVVILGRRGPAQASFTAPELLELAHLDDLDVVVEGYDFERDTLRTKLIGEYVDRGRLGRPKTLTMRFLASPVEVVGDGRVEGVRIVGNVLFEDDQGSITARATDSFETLDAGLLFRSVGYRADAFPGLPFDEARGILPNSEGRVIDADGNAPLPGTYVAGWLKRGPSGVIGTNKYCSQATVSSLLADAAAGRLAPPAGSIEALQALLAQRSPDRIDARGYKLIDRHERLMGAVQGRPRAKLCRVDDMVRIAGIAPTPTRPAETARPHPLAVPILDA